MMRRALVTAVETTPLLASGALHAYTMRRPGEEMPSAQEEAV